MDTCPPYRWTPSTTTASALHLPNQTIKTIVVGLIRFIPCLYCGKRLAQKHYSVSAFATNWVKFIEVMYTLDVISDFLISRWLYTYILIIYKKLTITLLIRNPSVTRVYLWTITTNLYVSSLVTIFCEECQHADKQSLACKVHEFFITEQLSLYSCCANSEWHTTIPPRQ